MECVWRGLESYELIKREGFLTNPIIPHPLNPNASDLHNIPLGFAHPLRSRSLCPDGLEAARSLVLLTLGVRGLSGEDRISPNTL
ncbi:hypothetical protein cypCar_00003509 [Cyprinus carpio]|nr:hypothetical protein cypCar_00003509 [Cyprinus carpio]